MGNIGRKNIMTNEKMPPQPAKTNVDLAHKYLNAEECEVLRTGKEPQARRSGLGLVGFGVLLIAVAAFLVGRSLKGDGTLRYATVGAWGGTYMILTGLCSILSGRGPERLPKIVHVLIGVASLPGAIGILLIVAWLGLK